MATRAASISGAFVVEGNSSSAPCSNESGLAFVCFSHFSTIAVFLAMFSLRVWIEGIVKKARL
jgi:hypothetical protein